MNLHNLNELPEWKDGHKDGEDWKEKPTLNACKTLYKKWNEITGMLCGALGSVKEIADEEEPFSKETKAMILGDAYEAGAKIRSSEAGDGMYILRMENAAIIRKNAQFIKTAILGLMIEGDVDEEHGEIIRKEIDVFRELFKKWVNTFEKDEYTDDWGLFI